MHLDQTNFKTEKFIRHDPFRERSINTSKHNTNISCHPRHFRNRIQVLIRSPTQSKQICGNKVYDINAIDIKSNWRKYRTFIVLTSPCVICEARSGAYEVVFEENKYNGSHELTSATAEEH